MRNFRIIFLEFEVDHLYLTSFSGRLGLLRFSLEIDSRDQVAHLKEHFSMETGIQCCRRFRVGIAVA